MFGKRNVVVDATRATRGWQDVTARDVHGVRGEDARIAAALAETAEWQADGSAFIPGYVDTQGMNVSIRSKHRG